MQLIGQVLQETYRIERLLGRGGKGEVYLASHERLPRNFAVKVLFPHNALKSEEVVRFRREAEVVSAIGHPHLIEVIDFNHTSWGAPYIVMELLEGEDLSARLKRVDRLDLEQTGTILKQVCSALEATHQQGVIHRDLKPSNIFLCRKGDQEDYVKVVDFGLSKVWGATVAVTDARLAIGTPRYMSPEQAMGRSSEADGRTDIFSLGAILFRALTGELPFIGESVTQLLNNIVFVEPPLVSEVMPEVPKKVSAVVAKALSKAPEDRFRSMEELWNAFEAASGLGFAAVASLSVGGSELPPTTEEATIPEIPSGRVRRPDPDPNPELSGTFTDTLGEMIEAENPSFPSAGYDSREVRRRRMRRATGLLVAATTTVVVVIGVWLGFRLVPGPAPRSGAATNDVQRTPETRDASVVAALPPDARQQQQVVRLRKRPDNARPARPPEATTPEQRSPEVTPPPKRRPRRKTRPRRRRFGQLFVQSLHKGQYMWATVYLNGKPVGRTPFTKKVPVGVYKVEARRLDLGYREVKRVRVQSGKQKKVILTLER
jgi:serine/threonine-protein kinase